MSGWEVCGLCFGSGHVIGEGGAPCGRCGGSGFVEVGDTLEYDTESEESK